MIVPQGDSSVQPGSLHCARRMSWLVYEIKIYFVRTRFDWLLSQDRSSLSLNFPKEMKVFLATFTSGKPGELTDDIDWSDELFIGSSSTCSETPFEFAILRCPMTPCIVSSTPCDLVLDKQSTWREPMEEGRCKLHFAPRVLFWLVIIALIWDRQSDTFWTLLYQFPLISMVKHLKWPC